MSEALFDSYNAPYVQSLYEAWARKPDDVPEVWRDFFARGTGVTRAAGLLVPESLSANGAQGLAPVGPVPASARTRDPVVRAASPGAAAAGPGEGVVGPGATEAARLQALLPVVARATSFVQAFRDHGHLLATIDPLGSEPPGHPQLDPSFFGTSMEELEAVPASVIMAEGEEGETVAHALRRLRRAYCGSIGYEFEHLVDPERVHWLWDQVERGVHTAPLSADDRRALLERLTRVEGLEQFLHRAYLGQKRFSIEGTDMLVPMLDLALREAAARGGRTVVMGMAHRGRLNVLAHILGVPYADILREFEGVKASGALTVAGTGDVKYHHGARGGYALPDGARIDVVLAPNPSHLEFVDPVVLGMARAWQFEARGGASTDQDTAAVVPVLIHGDAAFAAEGVVAETLNLARLQGYAVGGTIHVIVNNQIGFTTTPREGRSTLYASDLAKGYDFPILHVNADEPEACLAAVHLAMAYRDCFHDDVVIDLVGYRRHGHNEGDEPAYTQPRLYARIAEHATVRTLWARRLVDDGVVSDDDARAMEERVAESFREIQDRIVEEARGPRPPVENAPVEDVVPDTTVDLGRLVRLNDGALAVPDGFEVHPKLKRQLDRRRRGFDAETRLDWAYAETLALASLLEEGVVVRLTGQDTQRGTFSQRHLVLHDARDGTEHVPLAHVGGGRFEIHNSPLTEAAVVGFEYGYSVASELDLVLWEAQFGDFVNASQVAIDQFMASGRQKWGQVSNLSLLLPHGYEGQGPEHSSARLERFLQLCAEDNLRVVYPTTPAQYFHMLRRQAYARPERPQVVMTPKSLLRLPAASSTAAELAEGGFRPVLDDPGTGERRDAVRRLVLCSGKIYYDIQGHEERGSTERVAVARIEELYPFPTRELETLVAGYPSLEEVVWAQEEPRNMGALTFVGPRLRAVVPRTVPLRYVARPERASPSEGKSRDHTREQGRIVREALGLPSPES
jgi:2-oxoglutarate dehydrogenase E1 component